MATPVHTTVVHVGSYICVYTQKAGAMGSLGDQPKWTHITECTLSWYHLSHQWQGVVEARQLAENQSKFISHFEIGFMLFFRKEGNCCRLPSSILAA